VQKTEVESDVPLSRLWSLRSGGHDVESGAIRQQQEDPIGDMF
jgi:hypothetical protein